MSDPPPLPTRRKLPKLMACMTQSSLENLRSKALFGLDTLDAKGVRRRKLPLHECLILELKESGYNEASLYLTDLLYDNAQLVAEDDIGIIVDIRNRDDYLEHISKGLQAAERYRDKGNTKKEGLELLKLALFYSEQGKGIIWLAEKFFLAAIAVSSQFLIDGGRQKACCKYHYAKFLLDKFPGADTEEPFEILTDVRDTAIGKTWPLYERDDNEDYDGELPTDTVFCSCAVQLHRVLMSKARQARQGKQPDLCKAERLARLAERRGKDANEPDKAAEAIIEIGVCQLAMNNLNNALSTFERALKAYNANNNVEGLCESKMHLAAVMQKLGKTETAAQLLTEMGALAMEHGLRRHLGRALHLLGELHLRTENPWLGTRHLYEAFACFMGFSFQKFSSQQNLPTEQGENFDLIYDSKTEIHHEEAEQSRLMMAISAGQEEMFSYFNLVRDAAVCTVAAMKIINWKLTLFGWWTDICNYDVIPCMCPEHNRTPLDILRMPVKTVASTYSIPGTSLKRIHDITDIQAIRSSYTSTRNESVQAQE